MKKYHLYLSSAILHFTFYVLHFTFTLAFSSLADNEGSTFGYWQQPLKIAADLDAVAKKKAQYEAEALRRASLLEAEPKTPAESNTLARVTNEATRYCIFQNHFDDAKKFLAEVEKSPLLTGLVTQRNLDINRFHLADRMRDSAMRKVYLAKLRGYPKDAELFRILRNSNCFEYGEMLSYYEVLSEKEKPRTGFTAYDMAVELAAAGRNAEAIALCDVTATNTALKIAQRAAASVFAALLDGKKDFSVARKLCENDEAYFSALNNGAKKFFSVRNDPNSAARLKRFAEETESLLWPEERVEYKVRFLKDAPRSAEGAFRTDVFSKLPRENRFGVYNVYNPWYRETLVKRLKTQPKPHLQADTKGFEGAFAAACDATGLHLYVKCGDTNAVAALTGLSSGAEMEFDLQPGGERAAHWQWANTAKPQNYWGVEWDSPHPGYKLTQDGIKVDSYTSVDAHFFHVFAPWHMFYAELPHDGDIWRLVLYAGAPGHAGSLGGGGVHELGRGAKLIFTLSDSEIETIKLGAIQEAVAEYRKSRGEWENAGFWSDPHLGDPEFYEAIVKPFVEELDGIADEIAKTKLSTDRLNELADKYLSALSDFRLALDAKRTKYLKNRLFK